ncbi:hypothetical protein CDL12_08713 [Handroanthus impetiginosus]|uniref:EF-hand domain-containing protein n=1 Tax=Handroanthus impetiginosus TaxID=429701 RepID=A0A2G9HMT4_9LAMI|nr:hypothetical protein CDL12_08713 [Handroanthus impetiginosus]
MAKNDVQDPLLQQLVDSPHHSSWKNALTKRKHHRSKTVLKKTWHPEQNYEASLQKPKSIFESKLDYKLVLLVLLAYVGIGALCFFLVRYQIKGDKTNGIIDAIYLCIVTMTTVGYGDLVPDSTMAKFLACIFVFIGMGLVGFLLSKAADNIVENQEILLVKAMHMREKSSPGEILREVETNRAKYKFYTVLVSLLMLIFAGTIFLYEKEGLDLFDAFYCVCATITTLGYGDKSFSTSGGRIFAAFWILISTICLAQFFYSLAELYTERRRKSLVNWVLTRKLTSSDLEAADLDNDDAVSAAEFVVYKLKEMGKISQEDITMVMDSFKVLDVDQSGTLTKDDLLHPRK